MPQWNYSDDIPLIQVRIHGKNITITSLALVDTGAKYCAIHQKLAKALELEVTEKERLGGFGARKKFPVSLVQADIEIADVKNTVTVASVSPEHYPTVAPRIILGRNLLNKFRITPDGPNKRMIID